jgi:hypothetical protein
MVSSLLHVLIVTPVVFFWLHERRLGLQHQPLPVSSTTGVSRRWAAALIGAVMILVLATGVWLYSGRSSSPSTAVSGVVMQQVSSGDLRIALTSESGTLRQGRNDFMLEFRDDKGALVDVGTVRGTANMQMPGMVMPGAMEVQRTDTAGRYAATAEFGMAGAWPIAVEWSGPRGKGSVNLEGNVQ